MELIQFEEKRGKMDSLFSQETPLRDDFRQTERLMDDLSQEQGFQERDGIVLSPEGFFPLKIGMRVRHPKFGEGKVKSVEGMDEDQKATIVFRTVGSKRLKVCSARLEILV
jgi:hypothetical protein